MDELGSKGEEMATGIYYGLAKLCGPKYADSPLYPTVISVGWNPFYKNERKAIEAHLMVDGVCDCLSISH
jgi:riboflavin kinase